MQRLGLILPVLCLIACFGCTSESTDGAKPGDDSNSGDAQLPDGVFLAAKPDGAQPLAQVKSSAKKGDDVTFDARIGGRAEPFVAGRAIMVVIDPSLPSCADMEEDHCPVPWDYCCESPESLTTNTATVQFVDADGKPLALSLENQKGLKPLEWITVQGRVANKEESLFVVNVSGVFVGKGG